MPSLARRVALGLGLGAVADAAVGWAAAPASELQIATGGVTGLYYQIGAALCRLLERSGLMPEMVCRTAGTRGSIFNLTELRYGTMPLGIVQSDLAWQAQRGEGPFANQPPFRDLRSLFAVTTEALSILTTAESSARVADDLRGRRINVGRYGSGTRATFEAAMRAAGWSDADFAHLTDIPEAFQAEALCRGLIDALAMVVAHPSADLAATAFRCASPFRAPGRAHDRAADQRHSPTMSPPPFPAAATPTVRTPPRPSASAPWWWRRDAPRRQLVHAVVRALFSQLDQFHRLHPAFVGLTPAHMLGSCAMPPRAPGRSPLLCGGGSEPPPVHRSQLSRRPP